MDEYIQLHFTGSIPQHYDDYLGPMFFEPYAEDIGKLIDAGSIKNALELASGTGRITKHIRKALPLDATFIASDISRDMLTVAQKKLKDQNIEWQIIDAESLPFDENSLDLVVCYFGYMMVPNKDKAYAEAFRVLRKGGMLLMATWDKLVANEASHVFRMTLKHYLGDTLPESYKVPFSMHDRKLITSMLTNAGFSKVMSESVAKQCSADSAERAAYGLVRGGPLYNELVNRDPGLVDKIAATVENELATKFGKSPMSAPMSAIITRAQK